MTITVTPTVDAANWPPRVSLAVSASAGETRATIMRTGSDGYAVPVRTSDGGALPLSAGSGLTFDYEMTYGDGSTYSTVESPATVSAAVTVPASQVWLVHPGVPALSMPVTLRPGTLQDETYAAKQAVTYAMGRVNPLVITDGSRKGAQSSLTVGTQSSAELAAIRALVADAGVLLLNIPTTMGVDFPASYIAVADVKISRFTDIVIDSYRDVTLPFYVVDRPAGGTQAQRTLTDLTVYPTLAAINKAYPTLAAVLAGP